jgi:DNA polymerase II small subunit
MNKEILELIKNKGVLLEKEIFDVLDGCGNVGFAEKLLENFEQISGHKMITRASLSNNYEFARKFVEKLDSGTKTSFENIFVKLGVNLEIKKEKVRIDSEHEGVREPGKTQKKESEKYKIFYAETKPDKKIEVKDFVGHFRARYKELQKILMQRQGLENLTSINKISGNRTGLSLIGIVTEKRITKNKNLIIKFEDLTGEINALAKEGSECWKDATELQVDEVVAIKCSGSNEMVFINEILSPESVLPRKTKFDEDFCIAFLSDIHVGSKKFLKEEFGNFVYWLDSDNNLAKKIRYIFIVGDAVDGIGVFPGQEKHLELKSLKDQYDGFAEFMKKVPKHITVFMCPGQHDASRVLEPQPILDRTYAEALYGIDNFVMVSNPCTVKLLEGEKEFKILMYHGASIHPLINGIDELRLMKAQKNPAKAVKHMLKRRHLAPMHGVSRSIVYVPNIEKDPLVISEVPDLLCTGEVHRLDVERHNGTLILTGSCWQGRTDFEEKVGNIPDPCKVPVFNLKTHELKILDFTLSEERNQGRMDA